MDTQNMARQELLTPDLSIPESACTVQVRVIDTNTLLHLNPKLFWHPEIPNFDGIHAPIYCFLISNGTRHVIFDLGVRPDWQNYAPRVVSLVEATTTVTPGTDVSSVLDADTSGLGIRTADIEAVIWSHNHFDHIGDMSRFPHSTDLVVGPGVRAASWPGYPSDPNALVLYADADGRAVIEISFDGPNSLKIGRFDAFDYFGDGSFYLLDAPGHAPGHMCALARTESGSSSFVFLGADACHNLGVLRPSDYIPLPSSTALDDMLRVGLTAQELQPPCPCPGDLLHEYLGSTTSPFFIVARGPLFADYDAAMDTVAKIQELDAADNVLVLMAHDLSLSDQIPLFPKTINGWRASGLKTGTRWLFCGDFLPALVENNKQQT
ncbi:N-acyl homoserine lactonase AttM [Diplogelasinospora grovesii]|uniref:N-acyl homoserine lactonase AttM n=1 Tax=Diplogelasinospora grovesii TaxID=303347 RepID=A0AAN6N9H3_9PEZI|nr:N-acyl homoserine lactonase AttM [Diplogelasinospora grovesii]